MLRLMLNIVLFGCGGNGRKMKHWYADSGANMQFQK